MRVILVPGKDKKKFILGARFTLGFEMVQSLYTSVTIWNLTLFKCCVFFTV